MNMNVFARETKPFERNATIASIPLAAGDLPALALSVDEWRVIGQRMGWLPPDKGETLSWPAPSHRSA